ncbi:MAG TPA: hypothetical protein VGY55_19390 [Pirellulales bacterium]|jgi:hypothetical protein|nr:hypothetical protein [Pirellulales bacterium]
MLVNRCSWWFVVFLAIAMPSRGLAEDRDLAFLHALQERHYGDTAVDYLKTLRTSPDAPAAVVDVWDLELAKSLLDEARSIGDIAERARMIDEAQRHLNQFAKDKPNHPGALQAQLISATMVVDQANEALVAGRRMKDGAEKSAALAAARKTYEQARPLLESVVKNWSDRLTQMGPPPRGANLTKKQRDLLDARRRLETNLVQARAPLSLIDYDIAQTYTAKAEDGKRRNSLNAAAKALDDIFQQYRDKDPNSPEGQLALYVHSWNGKVDEELDGLDDAKAIYDEVLENFQDLSREAKSIFPNETGRDSKIYVKTEIDDILARTKHFSLLLLARNPRRVKEYLAQSREFIENEEYKKNLKTEWGYQAAALDLAEHVAAAAERESTPSEKDKLTREALKIAGEMAGIPSEFQREFIDLRNRLRPGAADSPQSVFEAMDEAGRAMEKKQWDEATKWLNKAQEIEEQQGAKKDASQLSRIREALASCAMQPISEKYRAASEKGNITKQQWTAWIDGAEKVARDYKKTLTAERAMEFALDCAAQLHRLTVEQEKSAAAARDKAAEKVAAADREAALKRLKDAVDYTLTTYPGTGEADKARMSLARINAMDGKYVEALQVYESIEPTSDKYAEALDMRGRIHDTLYLLERNKKEADRNTKAMEEHRQKAVRDFTESVAAAKKNLRPGDPYPDGLLKTQLVLAQIHLDAKEFKEASDVVDPFVATISAAKPMELDKTMLEMFSVALRADLGLNDFKKAGQAGAVLIDIGPDKTDINAALVSFVQRLDGERRTIQDTLNNLPDSTPPAEAEKIRAKFSSVKNMLGDLLTKLAGRQQLTPQTMVYIGNLFGDIEMTNEAEQQYRNVLEKANADPDFMKDKQNALLLNAVRAKEIGLLRKREKYQEAKEVADKLVAEFPDALEPLVERAKIYQDWAAKDPSKFDDAIGSWTEIRRRLERYVPPADPSGRTLSDRQRSLQQSYYDAVYNTVFCLLSQAKRLQAADRAAAIAKAQTGEKVLNSVLQFHPKLDGGEATPKRFAAIKAQLEAIRGAP